jgi:hypothetical protein
VASKPLVVSVIALAVPAGGDIRLHVGAFER